MNLVPRTSLAFLALAALAGGQVPDAQTSSAPAPAPAAPKQGGGVLGKDMPFFDPGSETFSWDGRTWNVNNNRVFQARFEKYLNTPEETSDEARRYRAIIDEILQRLSPGFASTQNLDYAFRLLAQGSNFDIDARLCDALANAVYTVWIAQRQQDRLVAANKALDWQIIQLEHSGAGKAQATQHAQEAKAKMKAPRGKGGAPPEVPTPTEAVPEAKKAALENGDWKTRRLGEMIARQKGNDVKRELSEIAAKVEFQALMVQFFLQRRYQHVIMATRFYRALFADGDSRLNMGKDTNELFQRSTGQPPTVSILDSLTNEAIRDVREGVKAFEFLAQNNELDSATKRLGEAFVVGEYMPEIRTLPREKKRRVVAYSHQSFQLISALEVKDYTLAETLVKEMAVGAKDFDSSKPIAAVETARTTARFLIAKARNAAISGDKKSLESALTQATEIWPRNPELAEASNLIFKRGDVQESAVIDFGQLLSQKNYRKIYEDNARFIAALSTFPDKQEQLKGVLENMKQIDTAILRADEMARQSNFAGAWESVEKAFAQFPDDSKLNQMRANFTTQAADFVRALRTAQDLEKQDQVGSSLAWNLKAQKIYPQSEFAADGIARLVKRALP